MTRKVDVPAGIWQRMRAAAMQKGVAFFPPLFAILKLQFIAVLLHHFTRQAVARNLLQSSTIQAGNCWTIAAAALHYFISSGLEVELQRRVSDTIIHRYENNATEPEIPLPFVKRRKKIEAHYQSLYLHCLSAGGKAEEIPALSTFPTSHSGDFVPPVCVLRVS